MPFQRNGKRDYKRELDWEHKKKPSRVKDRAQRNAARATVSKDLGKAAVKGKDVDHKKPISKGGTNARSNLRPKSPSANRSFKRTASGKVK